MTTAKTAVIFRVFSEKEGGDVIALFPEISGSYELSSCLSYMHIGQHAAAHPAFLIRDTRPATPEEYADLKAELEAIGYDLKVCKRQTGKHLDARMEAIRREYGNS